MLFIRFRFSFTQTMHSFVFCKAHSKSLPRIDLFSAAITRQSHTIRGSRLSKPFLFLCSTMPARCLKLFRLFYRDPRLTLKSGRLKFRLDYNMLQNGREESMRIECIAGLVTTCLLFMSFLAWTGDAETAVSQKLEKATFAGGCFWCMEPPFDRLGGVVSVTAGYTGGQKKNPSYEEVSSGTTGHAESVEVIYDPAKISYSKLLDVFWHNIDPTVKDRQFCDTGSQYRTAIFYHDEEQKMLAEQSKKMLIDAKRLKGPVYTEITPVAAFYKAEEYHQKYYKKNPVRYQFYRWNCGRDQRLKEIWGEDTDVHQ
jgi:peptide-methionine (S)-S-oxide reductase